MLNLKSVSKPRAVSLESFEAAAVAKKRSGERGTASGSESRAATAHIVTGKSDRRLSRSLSPVGALESVIEVDDRTRILETDLAPWRMICALKMFSPGGAGAAIGTGWLAGPKTIVTAGHCVHHMGFFGGWADRIEVSPGRDDANFPFGTVTSRQFSSVGRWVESADPDFDIGCIHLDEPIGEQTGWFPFASLTPSDLEARLVNISGYPGDLFSGRRQFFHANRILAVGARRIFYDVDTAGGQSGAPVWVQDDASSEPVVVGIHAYGTGGTPFDLGITANSAPRIIPEVFDMIEDWVGEAETVGAGA